MMVLVRIILLVLPFSSRAGSIENNKALLLNELWGQKASQEKIIQVLGPGFTNMNDEIIYRYPNSAVIESGHHFDKNKRLQYQFFFTDEKTLKEFKEKVVCNWLENLQAEIKGDAHSTYKIGRCDPKEISYKFWASKNSFEIRWGRLDPVPRPR